MSENDNDTGEAKRRAKMLNDAGIPREYILLTIDEVRSLKQEFSQLEEQWLNKTARVNELTKEGVRQANGWYDAKQENTELQKKVAALELEVEGLHADKETLKKQIDHLLELEGAELHMTTFIDPTQKKV